MNRLILKVYAWQNTATPWFWLFVISAGYLAVSYFFFQHCLFMSPTQTSALVRLGFAVAGVGALIGLLLPFGFIARLVAYALGFAGAAQCAQVAFAAFAAILAVMFAGFLYGRFTRSF